MSEGNEQWRGSLVKSDGVRVSQVKTSILEADRSSFSISAPKMGYLVIFGFLRFRLKNEFAFSFYFSFSFQKCHLRSAENVMFAIEP